MNNNEKEQMLDQMNEVTQDVTIEDCDGALINIETGEIVGYRLHRHE